MGLSIDTKGYGTVGYGKKSGESIISENVIKASGEVRTKQSREFMEGKGREGEGGGEAFALVVVGRGVDAVARPELRHFYSVTYSGP